MSPVRVRNAAAVGLMCALLASGVAVADTVVADGDAVTVGAQTQVFLGDRAPGEVVPLDVAFVLTCGGDSHAAGGSTLAVAVTYAGAPEDGTVTWDPTKPGEIVVPATWPPAAGCGDPAASALGTTPVHLVLTAPTVVEDDQAFDFLFAVDPADGVTNTIALTATMNVRVPTPSDTTPPVLSGVPADMTVFTPGTSAVVSWVMPTATDDTEPNPTVACVPASGSSFALGPTTVTCTATDAAGNASSASFTVTVRQLAASWGQPLDGTAVPALVGQLGRTIPLKLDVTAAGVTQGPGAVDAPTLSLDRLDGCTTGALALETRAGGTFAWVDGAWQLNLRTTDLAAGCWRLTAAVDGSPLASAVVRLTADATGQGSLQPQSKRPAR